MTARRNQPPLRRPHSPPLPRRLARNAIALLAIWVITPQIAQAQASDTTDLLDLRGIVRMFGGTTLPGIEIVFRTATGPPTQATSGAAGDFEVALEPGEYAVSVDADGYLPWKTVLNLDAKDARELTIELELSLRELDEVNVTASYSLMRSDPVSAVALSQEELLRVPHFGDDIVRALTLLPGVAGNDISAQFNVRGGLYRDTGQWFDGVEVFEPYHLKDFQGVFSIFDPESIGSVELLPGGFPATYGDRLAGILELETIAPSAANRLDLGISLSTASISAARSYPKSGWFASARRGYLDLLLSVAGEDDEEGEEEEGAGPQYWDTVARWDRSLSDRQNIGIRLLASGDSLEERESETDDFGFPELESVDSSYGNSYLWARHDAILAANAYVETILSAGRVDRDRRLTEEGFERAATIQDERALDVLSLKQDWSLQATPRHFLTTGFEIRRYEADYNYANSIEFDDSFADDRASRLDALFDEEHFSAYVSDRIRLREPLVLELGARFDRYSLTDESEVSPRVNLVWSPRSHGQFRFAWGQFFQSQRPNELQIEDGETTFFPAERSTHTQIGWEQSFSNSDRTYSLRADLYDRQIDPVRPRFDNLLTGFSLNPEIERDRVRLVPEESHARGVELSLSRRGGERYDWRVHYSIAEVEDRINGVDVPRSYDQRHALSAVWNGRFGKRWSYSFAWTYHSGWPTTPISAVLVEEEGELDIEPVIGPLFSERLDDYHRLDLRVSRTSNWANGRSFEFFIDIQNLYNRENQAGFAADERAFTIRPDGVVDYAPIEETFLGLLPSFGFRWSL